jgi:hypothetical protein
MGTSASARKLLVMLAIGLVVVTWLAIALPPSASYSSAARGGNENRSCESVWTQMTVSAPARINTLNASGPLGSKCSALSIGREHDAIVSVLLAVIAMTAWLTLRQRTRSRRLRPITP